MRGYWTVAACAAIVCISGCKSSDGDIDTAPTPKTYAFHGSIEPQYSGTWKSTNGTSSLTLGKDGRLRIKTVEHSVAGKTVSNVVGQWLVGNKSLMLRYASGSGDPTVLKYGATLSGRTLVLTQAGSRMATRYTRG